MTEEVHLPELISETFGGSRSDARRLIAQGAVNLDGVPLDDLDVPVKRLNGELSVGPGCRVNLKNGKTKYSSIPDTIAHINRVRDLLDQIVDEIQNRGDYHDVSKLQEPELSIFDEYTPKLKASTYGSPEYDEMREAMGGALVHHYANNRHHPEHWDNGVFGMSLIDIIEMLADWKAATERMDDGDLRRSIEINAKRFSMPSLLTGMLLKTAEDLGWV